MPAPPPKPHVIWDSQANTLINQRVVAQWKPDEGLSPSSLGAGPHHLYFELKETPKTAMVALYMQIKPNPVCENLTFYTIFPFLNSDVDFQEIKNEIDIPNTVKMFRDTTQPQEMTDDIDDGLDTNYGSSKPIIYHVRFHLQYAPRTMMRVFPAKAPERHLTAVAQNALSTLRSLTETKDFDLFFVDRSIDNLMPRWLLRLRAMMRTDSRKADTFDYMPREGELWDKNIWEHYYDPDMLLSDTDCDDDPEESAGKNRAKNVSRKTSSRADGKKFDRTIDLDQSRPSTKQPGNGNYPLPRSTRPHSSDLPVRGPTSRPSAADRHARKLSSRRSATRLSDPADPNSKRKRIDISMSDSENNKRIFVDQTVFDKYAANAAKGTEKQAAQHTTAQGTTKQDTKKQGTKEQVHEPANPTTSTSTELVRSVSYNDEMSWLPDDGFEEPTPPQIIPQVLQPGQGLHMSYNEAVGVPRPDQTEEIARRNRVKGQGNPAHATFSVAEGQGSEGGQLSTKQRPRLQMPPPQPRIASFDNASFGGSMQGVTTHPAVQVGGVGAAGGNGFNHANVMGNVNNMGYPNFMGNPFMGNANFMGNLNMGNANLMGNPNTGNANFMGNPFMGNANFMGNPNMGNANFMVNPYMGNAYGMGNAAMMGNATMFGNVNGMGSNAMMGNNTMFGNANAFGTGIGMGGPNNMGNAAMMGNNAASRDFNNVGNNVGNAMIGGGTLLEDANILGNIMGGNSANSGNVNSGSADNADRPDFLAQAQIIINQVQANALSKHIPDQPQRRALSDIAHRLARCWIVAGLALPTGSGIATLAVQIRGVRDGTTNHESNDMDESFMAETRMSLATMRAGWAASSTGASMGLGADRAANELMMQSVPVEGSPSEQAGKLLVWLKQVVARQVDVLVMDELVGLQSVAEMMESASRAEDVDAAVVRTLRERYLELAAWVVVLAIWKSGEL